MPKMKTNRGAAKRFKKTASFKAGGGGVKHGSAFKRHLLSNRSSGRKMGLRGVKYVCAADIREIKGLIPY